MKKAFFLVFTIIISVVYFFFFHQNKNTENGLSEIIIDLNNPTRYVFISDETLPQISVFDADNRSELGILKLKNSAHLLAINKQEAFLAYANLNQAELYFYDLKNHQQKNISLPNKPLNFLFDEENQTLLILFQEKVGILDLRSQSLETIGQFSDVVSFHYQPFSKDILVLTQNEIQVINLFNSEIQHYPFHSDWKNISLSALSPDGRFLLFGASKNQHFLGVIWDTEEKKILATPQLESSALQPYVDNSSKYLFFIAENGTGIRITGNNLSEKSAFQTIKNPELFAMGWLDKKIIVAGKQEMATIEVESLTTTQPISLKPADLNVKNIADVFITGDSKFALITQPHSSDLLFYDLNQNAVQTFPLIGIKRPKNILMGASYVLCH